MIKIINEDGTIYSINESCIEFVSYHPKEEIIIIHTGRYNSFKVKKNDNENIFDIFFK